MDRSNSTTVGTISELVHTTGGGECAAYTWEFNHDAATGIFQCDSGYLADVVQKLNCECNNICP